MTRRDTCALSIVDYIILLHWTSYPEVVEVATAVSLDSEDCEEQRDVIAGRSDDSHLTVSVLRVVSWPVWTQNATTQRRQHLVARYTSHHRVETKRNIWDTLRIFTSYGKTKTNTNLNPDPNR